MKQIKGFTLIELLVTITIIGILAVGGIQIFSEQIKKARDSTRVKDIKNLGMGIEQYILDNQLPYQGTNNKNFLEDSTIIRSFRDAHTTYIPNISKIYDPANDVDGNKCTLWEKIYHPIYGAEGHRCVYMYRTSINGYKIMARFES